MPGCCRPPRTSRSISRCHARATPSLLGRGCSLRTSGASQRRPPRRSPGAEAAHDAPLAIGGMLRRPGPAMAAKRRSEYARRASAPPRSAVGQVGADQRPAAAQLHVRLPPTRSARRLTPLLGAALPTVLLPSLAATVSCQTEKASSRQMTAILVLFRCHSHPAVGSRISKNLDAVLPTCRRRQPRPVATP